MRYIDAQHIRFAYEGQSESVFEDISFTLHHNHRIGLIGNNGSGKTTLFKLILGKIEPQKGSVVLRRNLVVGYLPQELVLPETMRLTDYLWSANPGLADLRQQMATIADFAHPEHLDLLADFEALGGYGFEAKLKKTLAGFELDIEKLDQPLIDCSGGEKTKVALCKLLLQAPDLLLLDEPTNHLDIDALFWLEEYLECSIKLPFIVISHDRTFLDRCVDRIWELGRDGLRDYSGGYSSFKREKEEEFRRQMAAYENQQKKLRQLRKTAQARKNWALTHQQQTGSEGRAPVYEDVANVARKAMKRSKNIEKRIELMIEREEAKRPLIEKKRKIYVESPELKNEYVLRVSNLAKCYGPHEILSDLCFFLRNGARLAVVGRNGSGKTTLLRILAGRDSPDRGTIQWAPQARIAYYAQEFENLDQSKTIIDEILEGDLTDQTEARTVLGCLNIQKDRVYEKIANLSIGERSKVALTKIILSDSNVLLLDEPTNHLEIQSKEAIEEAFSRFQGSMLLVSHDRYFISKLTTETLDLGSG